MSKLTKQIVNGKIQFFITTDYYSIPTENIKKHLYGEWLARKNKKPIGIVEAEKTPSAMSIYDDSKLWLATGGLSKIDQDSLEVYNRQLNFYPDIVAYNKLRIQVESMDLNTLIYDISKLWTSKGLKPPHEKADPVDYFFEHLDVRWDPNWSQNEKEFIIRF